MLILPDYCKPYALDSLTDPVVVKHNWMFHAPQVDFFLTPISYLEETSGAATKVRINNSEFWIPSTWFILVVDLDTYQIDSVSINSCASTNYSAFSFSPSELTVRTLDVRVLDFCDDMSLVHPMISKGYAMVHPVGPAPWAKGGQEEHISVVIGPHDLYKHLTNKVVGDIFYI